MKRISLAVLSILSLNVKAQADKSLPANETFDLRLIIGIVIAVVVIIAMYLLLRKEDN